MFLSDEKKHYLWGEKHSLKTKNELVQRIYKYFDKVNDDSVVYHWKYRFKEIDPSKNVAVDTLQPLKPG